MGDYNAIQSWEDRCNGDPVMEAEIRDFTDFLDNTRMTELKYVGREFTWTNSHVHSKIDRALEQQNNPKPFKIFNNLAEHKEFEGIVKTTWEMNMQGSAMKRVWLKFKRLKNGLKNELKQRHKKEYSTIHEKITLIRGELQRIQVQMRDPNHSEALKNDEKDLKEKLEKWSAIEESLLKQKSRIQWLMLGDSNSTFFHASIKNKNAQKKITKLVTQVGTVAEEIPAIEPDMLKKGSILTRTQQAKLIEPVTREKIVQTLQRTDDSKAPGCDGYNSLFIKKTWANIWDEVVEAV
ncbi:uncharacterized protein [Nicotiana sylvestris]|uniref:uncharacterized protein n=1 Tax=Nicotiana sylvestris TaxID=4096 RepID=UPI00388C9983